MPDGTHPRAAATTLTRFGCAAAPLDAGWELAVLPPGAALRPQELPCRLDWLPAPVPGHAFQLLGRPDLDDVDVWYRVTIPSGPGSRRIRFNGLATLADAWLDGVPLLASWSMFLAQEVPLPPGRALHLRFRALAPPPGLPRPRWRTSFAAPAFLRGLRTTLSGRLAGQPRRPIVGPWRPVEILTPRPGLPRFAAPRIEASLAPDGTGHLALRLPLAAHAIPPMPATLSVAGTEVPLFFDGEALSGEVSLPGIAPWWPHTHGEPALHALAVTLADRHRLDLGRIGFRRIEVDRGADGRGFALRINGEAVFCRGAAWADPDTTDPIDLLAQARDAGLNMIRIPGTLPPPDTGFLRACDRLGLLVWLDLPYARLDYPADDEAFRALAEAEARQMLQSIQGSPSLAVLCGGAEVAQQAAMLGLPDSMWSSPLFDDLFPAMAAELRPDVPYLPNAPYSPPGELPFRLESGIAHDHGIGGFRRPLSHARTTGLRFAAECLAFSHLPDAAGTEALGCLPTTPAWKAGIPRDAGAAWDFEDVRDHYLATLYRQDPAALRREDPERWLALSRAATAEAIEAAYAAWRRPGSGCGGALAIALQDTAPGAGWGVIGADGRPKPALHALRRAARPVQLLLLDDDLNGLAIHLLNETAAPIAATLSLDCWLGATSVARGRRDVAIPPRGVLSLPGEALFHGFLDALHAWRFGPLRHEAVHARLDAPDAGPGVPPLATGTLFPAGRGLPRRDLGLTATLDADHNLLIATRGFAESVQIEDEAGFLPAEDFFHLAPGRPVRIPLRRGRGAKAVPHGRVLALNGEAAAPYGGPG